jgi:hypothetical protein
VALGRFLSGSFAVFCGVVLLFHISIVGAFGDGDVEATAAIVLGAAVIFVLISMWAFERPRRYLLRTAVCLCLVVSYVGAFVLV